MYYSLLEISVGILVRALDSKLTTCCRPPFPFQAIVSKPQLKHSVRIYKGIGRGGTSWVDYTLAIGILSLHHRQGSTSGMVVVA